MAEAKLEKAGDLVAHLIRSIPAAVWEPSSLPADLNPFHRESEAMREHRAKWNLRRLRAAAQTAEG